MSFKSVLGALKDFAIEPEKSETASRPAAQDPVSAAMPAGLPTDISAAAPVAVSGSGLDVDKAVADLDAMIQASPAFAPFASFLRMAKNMEKAVPDDAQRFSAVQLATESKLDDLLAAVNSHAQVLADAKSGFEAGFVASTEQSLAQLSQQEGDLDTQIAALATQIAQLNAQKDGITKQIRTGKADLNKQRIDFATVIDTLSARYQSWATKLQAHLGSQQ